MRLSRQVPTSAWDRVRSALNVLRSMGPAAVWLTARYALRYARWQRAYQPAPESGGPGFLGDLLRCVPVAGTTGEMHGFELQCRGGALRIEFVAEGVAQVRLSRDGSFPDFYSYALADPGAGEKAAGAGAGEAAAGLVRGEPELSETFEVKGPGITVRVSPRPCRLAFLDADGKVLCEDGDGAGWRGNAVCYAGRAAAGERFYGLGDKAFNLDYRGRTLALRNTDPGGSFAPEADPLYTNIPFLVRQRDGCSAGLLFDNTSAGEIDLGSGDAESLLYRAGAGELRYYVLAGPAPRGVMARYAQLTGHMELPPLWALGYHQSRWSYGSAAEVGELAAALRSNRIPCDAIHLDIHYMDGYRVFTWDRRSFPDPRGMIGDLARQGFKVVTIVDPGVKIDRRFAVYRDGLQEDVFCKLPAGRPFSGPVWPGECRFPDFASARVRAWWGRHCRSLLDLGVAGLWNDMNEPAIFARASFPDAVRHAADAGPTEHRALHNAYGLLMARASYEAFSHAPANQRPLLISRAGYAGIQRYALTWTGDNESTWENLRLSIPMVLNLGLSGQPFAGPDTGGFAGDADGELVARWTQLGAFLPFFRNHSALGTIHQEPFAFGEPWLSICRRWIEWRYRLLPYIYTAFWQATEQGTPVARPLCFEFPADPHTGSLDDEYLFGDSLLVAPVMQPGTSSRHVYLPAGGWFDFWTGREYSGPVDLEVDAPLDHLPLFVRAGSVVPLGPVMQYAGECAPETLELHVFAGSAENSLYEDDGQTTAYREGDRRVSNFRVAEDGDGLTLTRSAEGRFTPKYGGFDILLRGQSRGDQGMRLWLDGKPVEEPPLDPFWRVPRIAAGWFTRLDVRFV